MKDKSETDSENTQSEGCVGLTAAMDAFAQAVGNRALDEFADLIRAGARATTEADKDAVYKALLAASPAVYGLVALAGLDQNPILCRAHAVYAVEQLEGQIGVAKDIFRSVLQLAHLPEHMRVAVREWLADVDEGDEHETGN